MIEEALILTLIASESSSLKGGRKRRIEETGTRPQAPHTEKRPTAQAVPVSELINKKFVESKKYGRRVRLKLPIKTQGHPPRRQFMQGKARHSTENHRKEHRILKEVNWGKGSQSTRRGRNRPIRKGSHDQVSSSTKKAKSQTKKHMVETDSKEPKKNIKQGEKVPGQLSATTYKLI